MTLVGAFGFLIGLSYQSYKNTGSALSRAGLAASGGGLAWSPDGSAEDRFEGGFGQVMGLIEDTNRRAEDRGFHSEDRGVAPALYLSPSPEDVDPDSLFYQPGTANGPATLFSD